MTREYERILRESFKITGVTEGRVIDLMKELEKEEKDHREKAEQLANIKKVNVDLRAKCKNLETKYNNALDSIDALAKLVAEKIDPSEWGRASEIVKPYHDRIMEREKWTKAINENHEANMVKYRQRGIGEYIKQHHQFPAEDTWHNSVLKRSPNVLKRLLVCIDFIESDERTMVLPLFTDGTPYAEKHAYRSAFKYLGVPCYVIPSRDKLMAMKYYEDAHPEEAAQ